MVEGAFRPAFVRGPQDGHLLWWLGGPIRYVALGPETGGRYTASVSPIAAGGGPAPHVHSREIECFYLVDGGPVAFTAGNRQVRLGTRGFVALCPGTAHRFTVEGAGTVFLFCAPAGFDAFQLEAGEPLAGHEAPRKAREADRARVAAVAPRYGVTMMPGDASFAREPVAIVSAPGDGAVEAAPGVTVRHLADGARTGGFFAMAELELAPGAAFEEHPPAGAEAGLFVAGGAVQVGNDGRDLGALPGGAFAALRPDSPLCLRNAAEVPCVLLLWVAPAARRRAVGEG